MTRRRLVLRELLLRLIQVYRRGAPSGSRIFCLPGDHVGDRIFLDGLYERDILEPIFARVLAPHLTRFGACECLDVGANVGNHSVFFSRYFRQVHAFEPNPILCNVMNATLELNDITNVRVFPYGLSSADTQLDYVMVAGELGHSYFSSTRTETSVPLEVRRGDTVLAEERVGEVALVKIDVEGHEGPALAGLTETIRRHKPFILFEAKAREDAEGCAAVLETVRRHGCPYIYAFESPPNPFRRRALKALYRLAVGSGRTLVPLELPLDARDYLVVIASPEPLELR